MPLMFINSRSDRQEERLGQLFSGSGSYELCYKLKDQSVGKESGFFTVTINDALTSFLLQKSVDNEALQSLLDSFRAKVARYESCTTNEVFPVFIDECRASPKSLQLLLNLIERNEDAFDTFMYKMDRPSKAAAKSKHRLSALKEYILSCYAHVFCRLNQQVTLGVIIDGSVADNHKNKSKSGFLLKCHIFPELVSGDQHLLGANKAPFRGMFVSDPDDDQPEAIAISGLGLQLILNLCADDLDAIGARGQNIGLVKAGDHYEIRGFDSGNGFHTPKYINLVKDMVVKSLQNNFHYDDPSLTKLAPSVLIKEKSSFGVLRHLMLRNYSVFKNCSYVEKLAGVQLLKTMFTGEVPEETIIAEYEGLLPGFREHMQHTIDYQQEHQPALQEEVETMSAFACVSKTLKNELNDLRDEAHFNDQELVDFTQYIDSIEKKFSTNIAHALEVFESRLKLGPHYALMLDNLEKCISPCTTFHQVGDHTVLLHELTIQPPHGRIVCDLELSDDEGFTLTIDSKDLHTLFFKIWKFSPPLEPDIKHLSEPKSCTVIRGTIDQLETLRKNIQQFYDEVKLGRSLQDGFNLVTYR